MAQLLALLEKLESSLSSPAAARAELGLIMAIAPVVEARFPASKKALDAVIELLQGVAGQA